MAIFYPPLASIITKIQLNHVNEKRIAQAIQHMIQIDIIVALFFLDGILNHISRHVWSK